MATLFVKTLTVTNAAEAARLQHNPAYYCWHLVVTLGWHGGPETTAFRLTACTPEYLERTTYEPLWGPGLLIVKDYDLDAIRKSVDALVRQQPGRSFASLIHGLAGFMVPDPTSPREDVENTPASVEQRFPRPVYTYAPDLPGPSQPSSQPHP